MDVIVHVITDLLSLGIIGWLGVTALNAWRHGNEWVAITLGAMTIVQIVRLARANGAS